LAIGLVMGLARDQAGELLEHVAALRPRVDAVRSAQGRELIVFLAPALDALATVEARDVGGAAGRQRAVDFPEHGAVDDRLRGARRRGFAGAPATSDTGRVELGRDHQTAGLIDADADLLHDDRGKRSAAKRQDVDGRRRGAGSKPKSAAELATRKVMALLDELALAGETAQLLAVELDVAADRIGTAREALTLLDRVDRGE